MFIMNFLGLGKYLFYVLLIITFLSCRKKCDCEQLIIDLEKTRKEKGFIDISLEEWEAIDTDNYTYCRYEKKNKNKTPYLDNIDVNFQILNAKIKPESESLYYVIEELGNCHNADIDIGIKSFRVNLSYDYNKVTSYYQSCYFTKLEKDSAVYYPFWQQAMCILKNQERVLDEDLPNIEFDCDSPSKERFYKVKR